MESDVACLYPIKEFLSISRRPHEKQEIETVPFFYCVVIQYYRIYFYSVYGAHHIVFTKLLVISKSHWAQKTGSG